LTGGNYNAVIVPYQLWANLQWGWVHHNMLWSPRGGHDVVTAQPPWTFVQDRVVGAMQIVSQFSVIEFYK